MEVEFLGIAFRNVNHLDWFITTQFVLWLVIWITAIFKYYGEEPWFMMILFPILALFYGSLSYGAYVWTEGGTVVASEYLSPDCVWYNASLAIAYLVLAVIFLWPKWRRTRARFKVID